MDGNYHIVLSDSRSTLITAAAALTLVPISNGPAPSRLRSNLHRKGKAILFDANDLRPSRQCQRQA